jgi:hypothetical protein
MTKIAKVSLSGDVEMAIQETCDIYEAAGFVLRGITAITIANSALLVFQKPDQDPVTSTSQVAS